tara:strand:- start:63249 stop:63653 length:405 start_codon:yes stop_codon:yes gene_type:complete
VSTTTSEAREAIYQRFVDNTTLVNFTLMNEKYTAPTDTMWARVTVNHDTGEQDSLGGIGSRKFLRRGRVLIQIYDQVDNGIDELDTIAQLTRNIFEGVSFAGLYFTNVDIRETGQDGEWYQMIVDAPFDYQETK